MRRTGRSIPPGIWAATLASAVLGCAREDLGIDPFREGPEQLHVPFGAARIPPLAVASQPSPEDVLVVASTNFDQRFNAGTLSAYGLQALSELAPPRAASCADQEVRFDPSFGGDAGTPAHRAAVRIQSASGPLTPFSFKGAWVLALPTRFDQSVTLAQVNPSAPEPGGILNCRGPSEARLGATDCSARFVIRLGFDDPFDVQRVAGLGLVVGHVTDPDPRQRAFTGSPSIGYLSVISEARLDARLGPPGGAGPVSQPPPLAFVFGLDGARAVQAPGPDPVSEVFVSTDREFAGEVPVVRIPTTALQDLPPPPPGRLTADLTDLGNRLIEPEDRIDLVPTTQGFGTRGLLHLPAEAGLPARLYATVRVFEVQDSDNSVLAVLSAEDGRLRVQGLLEVGEELGQPVPYPFAPPGQRWLYVPDTRDDRIYVVDVTSDVPTVRARIDGRAVRTLPSGRQILARTLATPLSIVFDRRGGRRFAYVTNFENSTLAVIDVSDDNPLQHCVVARFGRDRALDGSTEAEGATL